MLLVMPLVYYIAPQPRTTTLFDQTGAYVSYTKVRLTTTASFALGSSARCGSGSRHCSRPQHHSESQKIPTMPLNSPSKKSPWSSFSPDSTRVIPGTYEYSFFSFYSASGRRPPFLGTAITQQGGGTASRPPLTSSARSRRLSSRRLLPNTAGRYPDRVRLTRIREKRHPPRTLKAFRSNCCVIARKDACYDSTIVFRPTFSETHHMLSTWYGTR